ncbi:MAG: LptF/LptG family permease [Alistipes indistinctus]
MKTVHKLVLKSYLGPMILTFFIVMFVLIMQFMWRYIDELVGKGLDMSVIGELMFWAAMTLVPMGTAAGHVVGRDYDAGKSR